MLIRIILPEDTLESIAREINLEKPEFILQFHNSQCAKEDLIKDKLIPWKKLHIPGKKFVDKINAEVFEELAKPKYNPEIQFFPKSLDGIFRTIILESSTNVYNKKEVVKIMYDVCLKYIHTHNNFHVIEYSKSNFKTSHEGMLSDLALKCFEKISPLLIFLNDKGSVEKIEIKKEISDNFSEIKKEISDYFVGEIADKYIEDFEFAVKNSELFDIKMKNDLFIKTYFASIRNKFEYGKSSAKISFNAAEWQIEQKPEENNHGKLKILQSLSTGFLQEDEKSRNYEGQYVFDPKTFLIHECNVVFQQKFRSSENETKINIKKL